MEQINKLCYAVLIKQGGNHMRIKVKRIIAMPLIFIFMFTSCLYIYPRQVEAKESCIYQGERFEVKFYLDSVYDGGYNARMESRY